MTGTAAFAALERVLKAAGVHYALFSDVHPNPLDTDMDAPLVIPGVILGISLLFFANTVGLFLENSLGLDVKLLSPGFWLVVVGQFSFIATIVTLVIIARLRKFDRTLEEAAYNLGANRFEVIWYITLKYLQPAIISGFAVAFLMSFENFNTSVFLVGSRATLPINLYAGKSRAKKG